MRLMITRTSARWLAMAHLCFSAVSSLPSLLFSATSADVCFVTSFRYQDLPPNYSSDLLRRMKNEKERTTKIGYV